MNHHHSMIALIAVIASPAFAASASLIVAGEIGYVPEQQTSTNSRTAVLAELQAWRLKPMTSDGWHQVNGEAGWEHAGTPSALSRQQVQLDAMRQWRQLGSADGYRFVGGEAGWVYVGTRPVSDAAELRMRAASR